MIKAKGPLVYLRSLSQKDSLLFFNKVQKSTFFLQDTLPWVLDIQSISDASRFIETYSFQEELDNGGLYGVFSNKNHTLLGVFYQHWIHWQHLSTAIAYCIFEEHTQKGYGSEALYLLCQYLFRHLKLNRIEADIAEHNLQSLALVQKSNFQKEGYFREYSMSQSKLSNHYRYALLQRDFLE